MELVHVVLREIGDFVVRDDRFMVRPYHRAFTDKPAASLGVQCVPVTTQGRSAPNLELL